MIRILHVLGELRASGAEVALEKAGPIWPAHAIECEIVATGTERGEFAGSLETAGYAVHHLPFTGDLAFLRSYVALVRSGNYDVVHVHMERASVYLCLAARVAGAKVVRTIRACYPFEGKLARRRRLQRWLARRTGTRFVAISQSVAENELQRFKNPTIHIDNWVDDERFRVPSVDERRRARMVHHVPAHAVAIVSVGNCAQVKNHAALLEALARTPDPSWVWLHVGEEDPERQEHQLARNLGVADRCRFLGRADPLTAFHAADLYTMPSLVEGLGMATVEALSTGLPALLTDVPGNRDLASTSARITWSGSGKADLASALPSAMAMARDRELERVEAAQHRMIESRFGLHRGVAAYTRLYRSQASLRPSGQWLANSSGPRWRRRSPRKS
jgi:glycosyltransferase involved in cell wall biosynthesis